MRGLLAGILVLGLVACAKNDAGSNAGGVAEAAPSPQVVHFTARDFAFEGPATIPSGMTTIVLHNDGPELHHLMLMRLEDGHTLDDLRAGVAKMKPTDMPPPWAVISGGVNPPMPGADTQATLMLEPGTYAVTCVVDVPDHIPHIMKGMISDLTVTPSTAPAAPAPASDVTVTAVDFAFAFSKPLTAGHHVIKFQNDGQQPHELEIVKLAPGKTLDDLAKWGQTYQGDLPGTSLGGASPMSPGQVEYIPMDFTPGDYVALCFVLDPAKHMPHLAEGMVTPFTIS